MEQIQAFNYKQALSNLIQSQKIGNSLEGKEKFKNLSGLKTSLEKIKVLMQSLSSQDLSSSLYHFMQLSSDNAVILVQGCISVVNGRYSVDERNHASIKFFKELKQTISSPVDEITYYNQTVMPKEQNENDSLVLNHKIFVEIDSIFRKLDLCDASSIFGAWLSTSHHTTQQIFTRCLVEAMAMILNTDNENAELCAIARKALSCSKNLSFSYL